jgi:hypothetical protein
MQHVGDDYSDLQPVLIESIQGSDVTQWCVDCLLDCPQIDESMRCFINHNLPEQSPSTPTPDECVCHQHKLHCCSRASKSKDRDDARNDFLGMDTQHDLEIQQKYEELLEIDPDDHETLGQWLLWVGDYEIRNKKMYALVYSQNDDDPIMRDYLLYLISFARSFTIKTACHHELPKPYTNCCCKFNESHVHCLINSLKEAGFLVEIK